MIRTNTQLFSTTALCTALIVAMQIALAPGVAAQQAPEDSGSVALVLAGGAALGFAHVGVIRALEEAGVEPDIVVGTSIGSIIGALYASGYSAAEITEVVTTTDWQSLFFGDLDRRRVPVQQRFWREWSQIIISLDAQNRITDTGLSAAQEVVEYFDRLLTAYPYELDFDTLPRRFRAIALDIVTGEEIVYASGDLKTAIRASMAIPAVFTPVFYRDRYAIDGGWVNSVPVDRALELGAETVIAVPLLGLTDDPQELTTLAAINEQATQIRINDQVTRQLERASVVVRPDLTGYSVTDFGRAEELIEVGYAAGLAAIDQLRTVAGDQGPPNRDASAALAADAGDNTVIEIAEVVWSDPTVESLAAETGSRDWRPTLTAQLLGEQTLSSVRSAVYELHDSGLVTHAWYRLTPRADGSYTLSIDAPLLPSVQSLIATSLRHEGQLVDNVISETEATVSYYRLFGERNRNVFAAGAAISSTPELDLTLLTQAPRLFDAAVSGYVQQDRAYIYDDERVEAFYAVRRPGLRTSIGVPVGSSGLVTVAPYTELREVARVYGSRLFDDQLTGGGGVAAQALFDTLDRDAAPTAGVLAAATADLWLPQWSSPTTTAAVSAKAYLSPVDWLTFRPRIEFAEVLDGAAEPYELPTTGGVERAWGYYPQELRASSVAVGGLAARVRVSAIAGQAIDGLYAQLAANTVSVADGSLLDGYSNRRFEHGAAFGFVAATPIGEVHAHFALSDSWRPVTYLALRSPQPPRY